LDATMRQTRFAQLKWSGDADRVHLDTGEV
jgi:hypothetical protein